MSASTHIVVVLSLTVFCQYVYAVVQHPPQKHQAPRPAWFTNSSPHKGVTFVTLEVHSCKSASLHVITDTPSSDMTIEFGKGHNRDVALFDSRMALLAYKTYPATYGPVLSCTGWMPFWLSWSNGQFSIGKGNVVNKQVLLSHKLTRPIQIKYLRSVAVSTKWRFNTACLCENGGRCIYLSGNRQICRCLKQFTGAKCEKACLCKKGYCFRHCCLVAGHKVCKSACHCYYGYTGPNCDKACPCKYGKCKPFKTCTKPNQTAVNAICQCYKGFTGKYCNKPIKRPGCGCRHGRCIPGHCLTIFLRRICYPARCHCYQGFTGKYCSKRIGIVCKHGTVVQRLRHYKNMRTGRIYQKTVRICRCFKGFTGSRCDFKVYSEKCHCPRGNRCVYSYKCQFKTRTCKRFVRYCACEAMYNVHIARMKAHVSCKCVHGTCVKYIRGMLRCKKVGRLTACCRHLHVINKCHCVRGYGGGRCHINLIKGKQKAPAAKQNSVVLASAQKNAGQVQKKVPVPVKAPSGNKNKKPHPKKRSLAKRSHEP